MGMSPTKKQLEFILDADKRVNILTGAIRSGKTYGTLVPFFLHAYNAPDGYMCAVVATTRDSAWRNIVRVLQDPNVMGSEFAASVVGNPGAESFMIGKTKVAIHGAANRMAVGRIKGAEYYGILFDEITELNQMTFEQALGRMSLPGAKAWGTTNPDHPQHWFKKNYLDNIGTSEDKYNWFHDTFQIFDNTALDKETVDSLVNQFKNSPVFYNRNILGLWEAGTGRIYDNFNPEKHVVAFDDLPPLAKVYGVGLDAGIVDATACILVGLTDEENPRVVILDEYRHDRNENYMNMSPLQISEQLITWMEDTQHHPYDPAIPPVMFIDPSGRWLSRQLMSGGINNIRLADNDIINGISSVSSLFSMDMILISDRCEGVLKEITGYSWDSSNGVTKNRPADGNDHSMDALRYIVQSVWDEIEYDLNIAL